MPDNLYVVGIGASAGGLDAMKDFFRNIDKDIDVAFVVIQHLAKDQKGYLTELLGKVTDIPIQEVGKKTKIEKNNIYVIPPKYYLEVTDGHLSLKKRNKKDAINYAIDTFFTTLAEKVENKAIGIILSGMGTDGALGARKLKEMGGMVMVQAPGSAEFSSMPFAAILSDHPDVIDTAPELAEHLVKYVQMPEVVKPDVEKKDAVNNVLVIEQILTQVSQYSGVNFRDYKVNTILRRIDKRIKINHLFSVEDYQKLLSDDPQEIKLLYNDLLIGVTEFFRDQPIYKTLKEKVIPEVCHKYKSHQTLRIWVAACSTGEEAYSIAMLFEEYIQQHKLSLDFKIFASDLNPKAIALAGRGRFSEQIEKQVPSELLEKYFIKVDNSYEVVRDLRKRIIFSVHNILSDPPFIRLDFMSCRNLFIYLKEEVQKKLLYTFNYSLNADGYLLLGANETEGDLLDTFQRLSSKSKIFKNKAGSKRLRTEFTSTFDYRSYAPIGFSEPPKLKTAKYTDKEKFADILVDKYAPDALLLSEDDEVVYASKGVEQFIEFPKRKSNLNIFEMVPEVVALMIRNGLNKVRGSDTEIMIKNVAGFQKKPETSIDLKFSTYGLEKLVIVEFDGHKETSEQSNILEVAPKDLLDEVERLGSELKRTKRELLYNYDELEAINEELQSSNEEMKSSNEEMQTTNEELQSTNEELKTVNHELQAKIDEITILHNDVNNLFISTEIATLFLDRDLRIRKYTPALKRYFNIRESDIGRPISHYTNNFHYDKLTEDFKKVLSTLEPVQREIHDENGYGILRVIPYKTDDLRIEGVIITIVDVTDLQESNLKLKMRTEQLRQSGAKLAQSKQYWRSLVENSPDVIARIDKLHKIKYVNESLASHLKIDVQSVIDKNLEKAGLTDKEGSKNLVEKIRKVFNTKTSVDFYQNMNVQGQLKYYYFTILPEWDEDTPEISSVLLIARDITTLREAEESVELKNRRLEEMNHYMDNFVHAVAHDLRSPITNIKLILELIDAEDDGKKKSMLISKFGSAVDRLDGILSGLIEIVDSQLKTSEKSQKISIATVIDNVLQQLPAEVDKDFKIHRDLKVTEITYVRGYLYSILRNLLSNCIKYKDDKRPLKINVRTRKENGFVVLEVEDNGIGMDIERISSDLFKPFKRFNERIEGQGIGLHIIKSMIEKTGGRIDVDSEQSKGTTFYLYLKDQ